MKGSRGRSKVSCISSFSSMNTFPLSAALRSAECEELTRHFLSPGGVAVLQRGPGTRPHRLRLLAEGRQRVQHGPVRPGTDGWRAGPAQQQNTGAYTHTHTHTQLCSIFPHPQTHSWGRVLKGHTRFLTPPHLNMIGRKGGEGLSGRGQG